MSDNLIILTENIAVYETDNTSLDSRLSLHPDYDTVSLAIAPSTSLIEDKDISIKIIFGSWIESGEEDAQLDQLYKSRLIPSS